MPGIFSNREKGSVTLEYVIVIGIAIPVWVMWMTIYNSDEGYTEIGLLMVEFFQRILSGIALPIP